MMNDPSVKTLLACNEKLCFGILFDPNFEIKCATSFAEEFLKAFDEKYLLLNQSFKLFMDK